MRAICAGSLSKMASNSSLVALYMVVMIWDMKLLPVSGEVTPNMRAIVAARSTKVSRTPKLTPGHTGLPVIKMGTYSREWSVLGVVGSLP